MLALPTLAGISGASGVPGGAEALGDAAPGVTEVDS